MVEPPAGALASAPQFRVRCRVVPTCSKETCSHSLLLLLAALSSLNGRVQRQRTFQSRNQTDPITGNKLSHPITFDTVVAATRFPSHSLTDPIRGIYFSQIITQKGPGQRRGRQEQTCTFFICQRMKGEKTE